MERALTVNSRSVEETRILGASLAPLLLPGDVVSLSGDLGAGKTTFVQGVATALGVTARVTSPTFMIVRQYEGRYPIVHMDVYRLDSIQEVLDLGFEELFEPKGVMFVEWGEAVTPLLPRRYLEIEMRRANGDDPEARMVVFRPMGPDWARKLERMRVTADTLLDAASAEASSGTRFWYASGLGARDHMGTREDEDLEG